ncbi:hypothetical protein BO83DRAFT_382865 [Aspergillus eucalypticola CBS 122712]|uniref:Uncharacterized protein n=1 Tax=Aspergillus eucalypticola (strain CBS 122712 / IBT 29274) TaxID=1448314 RepID=A0A317UPB3_ASPEC|nr:uncharacterized protein BO83DRAFT_382865 [Aspergillus eucalypticola CBS 122712]PWY63259.1 hypothetical protein BO83DRAFT_382865 [Aspergillus eucalypticola CBS 122712]
MPRSPRIPFFALSLSLSVSPVLLLPPEANKRTCPISDSQPNSFIPHVSPPIHTLNSTDLPIHPLGPRTLIHKIPQSSHSLQK